MKKEKNYTKRNEYRVAEQGKSWKFKLMNAIDLSLAESNCKNDFIKNMNKLGYQVNWTDSRKYITYTTLKNINVEIINYMMKIFKRSNGK